MEELTLKLAIPVSWIAFFTWSVIYYVNTVQILGVKSSNKTIFYSRYTSAETTLWMKYESIFEMTLAIIEMHGLPYGLFIQTRNSKLFVPTT